MDSSIIPQPQQLAAQVVQRRMHLLLEYADERLKKKIEEGGYTAKFDRSIKILGERPSLQQLFLQDLIIASTRVWEALTKDQETKQEIFKGWSEKQDLIYRMIKEDSLRVSACFIDEYPLSVNLIEGVVRQNLLATIEENLLNNYEIVKKLIGEAASKEKVKAYFKEVKLYSFSQITLDPLLNGLSSFDGQRIYYKKDLQDPDVDNNILIQVIEHESIHNLVRFCRGNRDPFFISPQKNEALVEVNGGEMMESGDCYEQQAYGKQIKFISPFCFQSPYFKKTM